MKHIFSIFLGGFLLLTSCNSLSSAKSVKVWQRQDSLSERQVENLEALSSLYGYARYFYPNQQVAKFDGLDWYKFLVLAVGKTIDAKNDKELQSSLKEMFQPIIPELSFSSIGNNVPSKGNTFYAWRHYGIGYRIMENIFNSKIMTFTHRADSLPVPDSLYKFKLNDKLDVYYPLAISNQPQPSPAFELLQKQMNKVKFKLVDNMTLSLMKHLVGKNVDKKYVFLRDEHFRIADIIIHWTIVQHFYPYYQEDKLDKCWDTILKDCFLRTVCCHSPSEYYETILWMLGHVKDCHIIVQCNAYVGGMAAASTYWYVPNLDLDWINGQFYIKTVPDTLKDKVSKGDVLVSVNDIPIDTLIARKWDLIPSSTDAGKYEALAGSMLLGSSDLYNDCNDSILNIKVKNAASREFSFTTKIDSDSPIVEDYPYLVSEIKPGIYHINLTHNGADATYQEFRKYIDKLKTAKGIIIDVRGYPNYNLVYSLIPHFISDSVISGNFLTPIYYFPNQKHILYDKSGNEYLQPAKEHINAPVCILMNSKAVSFAETLLDIIKRGHIGTFIGQNTRGTNGDVSIIGTQAFSFYMTAVKDFSGYHGKGIAPDIYVSPTLQGIREGRDEIMDKALKYLKTK